MPNIVRRIVRSAKSRIRRGLKDGRTWALYEAALRLLARRDYEQISIAKFSREAGCSVGAFYGRFRDKNGFLYMVVSSAFHALTDRAARDLDPKHWRGMARDKVVEGIVRHIVTHMSSARAAGATRAALKLATINPEALEPLLEYRAAVADHAVSLLAPRLSFDDAAGAIRVAVQLIFGMVIDTTLSNAGPLRAGSRRMINTLTALTVSYLKLPRTGLAGENNDDDGPEAEPESDSSGSTAEGKSTDEGTGARVEVWDPDMRELVGTEQVALRRRRSRRRKDLVSPPKPLPVENVKDAKPPEPIEADERAAGKGRSGKRRIRRI